MAIISGATLADSAGYDTLMLSSCFPALDALVLPAALASWAALDAGGADPPHAASVSASRTAKVQSRVIARTLLPFLEGRGWGMVDLIFESHLRPNRSK